MCIFAEFDTFLIVIEVPQHRLLSCVSASSQVLQSNSVSTAAPAQHVIYSHTVHFWQSTVRMRFMLSVGANTNSSQQCMGVFFLGKEHIWKNMFHVVEFNRLKTETEM